MKLIITFFFILSFNVFYCQNSYHIIYEADAEGNTISGDIKELISYVQHGNPIRVGWVLTFKNPQNGESIEMQHWADAGFITTLNNHVFAQIHAIYQQGPGIGNPPSVFLVNDQPNGWVAILGTTGVMQQKYKRDEAMIQMMKESGLSDEDINSQLKAMETMNVHTKWAVLQH